MISTGQLRGYARKSPRHTAEAQERALIEAGCTEQTVYVEGRGRESFELWRRSLRPGDTAMVTSLGRLATSRDLVRERIVAILERGAVLVETTTGRRIEPACLGAVLAALDAADELAGDRRTWDATSAGAAARKRWGSAERMPLADARVIWRDAANYPTIPQALTAMPGWTRQRAYRDLGPRGTTVGGRPKRAGR